MKKIDIRLTKAQVTGYAVVLGEGLPEVTATIALYTSAGKEVSKFSLSTNTWQDLHFDLPIEMIPDIKAIADRFEVILLRECNKSLKLLEDKV